MRLIDADALREVHCEGCDETIRSICENDPVCATLMWVDEAPTVDAVPVVRCKDCKHYHENEGWCDKHSTFIDDRGVFCHPWESNEWKTFAPDDFCSHGERRGNNGID